MANDRPTPFEYSDVTGFSVQAPDRTQHPINYCPWCGETLRKRVGDGPIAPANEYARILDRVSTIRKPDECFEIFGTPDYDEPLPNDKGLPTDIFATSSITTSPIGTR